MSAPTLETLNDRIARLVGALEYTVATIDNCMSTMREIDEDETEEVEEELVTIRALVEELRSVSSL